MNFFFKYYVPNLLLVKLKLILVRIKFLLLRIKKGGWSTEYRLRSSLSEVWNELNERGKGKAGLANHDTGSSKFSN